MESITINKKDMQKLETLQGNLVKQCLGLSKRCHSTELLQALEIHKITTLVTRNTTSLYRRIMNVRCPVKYLNLYFLSLYMCKGTIVPGTLVGNLLQKGISPMHYTLNNNRINLPKFDSGINGHIDSIRDLLFHDNFIKPYSSQHLLAYMLTKAF